MRNCVSCRRSITMNEWVMRWLWLVARSRRNWRLLKSLKQFPEQTFHRRESCAIIVKRVNIINRISIVSKLKFMFPLSRRARETRSSFSISIEQEKHHRFAYRSAFYRDSRMLALTTLMRRETHKLRENGGARSGILLFGWISDDVIK